jgi:succinate dehydrogenase / fumarate reductase cytochrome b subunit
VRTFNRTRPVFFDLYRIRFPVTALVSLGHRISGVVLALAIPATVWLLALSLRGPDAFERAALALRGAGAKALLVVAAWALAHHALAGIRHLALDLHIGTSLPAARTSAIVVFVLEAAIVLAVIVLFA